MRAQPTPTAGSASSRSHQSRTPPKARPRPLLTASLRQLNSGNPAHTCRTRLRAVERQFHNPGNPPFRPIARQNRPDDSAEISRGRANRRRGVASIPRRETQRRRRDLVAVLDSSTFSPRFVDLRTSARNDAHDAMRGKHNDDLSVPRLFRSQTGSTDRGWPHQAALRSTSRRHR